MTHPVIVAIISAFFGTGVVFAVLALLLKRAKPGADQASFSSSRDVFSIVDQWAVRNGYSLINAQNGDKLYQKGSGIAVAAVFLEVGRRESSYVLRSYTKADMVFSKQFIPLSSPSLIAKLPRARAKRQVDELLASLAPEQLRMDVTAEGIGLPVAEGTPPLHGSKTRLPESKIKMAWSAAFLTAGGMTLLGVLSILGVKLPLALDWTLIIDALVIAGLGFGVYRKSRVCAVLLLVLFVSSKLLTFHDLGARSIAGIPVALAFAWFYWQGIAGTFAYHRERELQAKDTGSASGVG